VTDPTTTVERISPPASVKLNKLTSNTCVRLFDERQDHRERGAIVSLLVVPPPRP
jgi:hypothetical protein